MTAPRLVIAGDEETGEMYLAELLDDDPRGHDPPPRPIVRILRVARYPNQRAIAHPDTAMEFPTIEYGTILRMQVLREPPKGLQEIIASKGSSSKDYECSLRGSIRQAIREARSDEERSILYRHLSGDFRRKRVFIRFSEQNWPRIEATEGDFHRADG